MRFDNIRVVATVEVHRSGSGSGHSPKPRYEKKRKEQPEEKDWFDWASADPCQVSYGLGSHGFTVAMVSYDYIIKPKPPLPLGLNRREALSILKRMSLRPLTHLETFLLASEEIILSQLCPVMRPTYNPKKTPTRRNPHVDRYIVSPVSINVEFPYFYQFSIYGVRGREQFLRATYHKIEGKDGLYFDYNWAAGFNDKAIAFPMIMGVIPESINEKIMPAQKKIAFGALAGGSNGHWACPKCREDLHLYLGHRGSGCDLQCAKCDYVYWVECHQ